MREVNLNPGDLTVTMDRNVVLICLDTVRKDFFDEYAPRLRDLSDVSFEQCRTASGWTVPSHASIFSGELPHQHGVHIHNRDFRDLDYVFMSELEGHATIGVSANGHASSTFGLDWHFDEFADVNPVFRWFQEGEDIREFIRSYPLDGLKKYSNFVHFCREQESPVKTFGNGLVSKVNNIISGTAMPNFIDAGAVNISNHTSDLIDKVDEPLFIFNNFQDAHSPHQHNTGYDRNIHSVDSSWSSLEMEIPKNNIDLSEHKEDINNYRELYSAAIDYLDREIASMIEEIQAKTQLETTFIITADHGENLGYADQSGLIGHGGSLSEELLHVPLYIVNPPTGGYQEQETEYFSHLDMGALIKGLATNSSPDVFRSSIVAERIGAYNSSIEDPDVREWWGRMIRCGYKDDKKWVWDSLGNKCIYKISDGKSNEQDELPAEDDIPSNIGDQFDSEITEYKRIAESADEDISLDSMTKQHLEDLGYA